MPILETIIRGLVQFVVQAVSAIGNITRISSGTLPRPNRKIIVVVSLLTIVIALFLLARAFSPVRISSTPVPLIVLGEVTAQETVRQLNGGSQIVIIKQASDDDRSVTIPLKAFRKVISAAGIQIVATVNAVNEQPDAIPAEQFFHLLEQYPKVSAIVSFVGAPRLTDMEILQVRSNVPPWIVLNEPFPHKLEQLIREEIVQLAVISEPGVAGVKKPKTAREWFDRYYQFVTRQSLTVLQ